MSRPARRLTPNSGRKDLIKVLKKHGCSLGPKNRRGGHSPVKHGNNTVYTIGDPPWSKNTIASLMRVLALFSCMFVCGWCFLAAFLGPLFGWVAV